MCKTKCDRTYNGWTNYETWAVSLWMSNDLPQYRYWDDETQTATKQAEPLVWLADRIKSEHEEACDQMLEQAHFQQGPFADLLNAALSEVNWREIAQHLLDDHTE